MGNRDMNLNAGADPVSTLDHRPRFRSPASVCLTLLISALMVIGLLRALVIDYSSGLILLGVATAGLLIATEIRDVAASS
jgi:hypothetical protein